MAHGSTHPRAQGPSPPSAPGLSLLRPRLLVPAPLSPHAPSSALPSDGLEPQPRPAAPPGPSPLCPPRRGARLRCSPDAGFSKPREACGTVSAVRLRGEEAGGLAGAEATLSRRTVAPGWSSRGWSSSRGSLAGAFATHRDRGPRSGLRPRVSRKRDSVNVGVDPPPGQQVAGPRRPPAPAHRASPRRGCWTLLRVSAAGTTGRGLLGP